MSESHAAEEVEIAPVISIAVDGRSIIIEDNGPGIPAIRSTACSITTTECRHAKLM
jgi:DNA topoisomerase VI subunit B